MERIGQYSIIRTLGQGGMGVVYLAKDEVLDREVAIKCVKPEFAHTEIGQQLRREARTLAKLNDENIVRLYDLIVDDEQLAVVMEYVDGRNLRELLDQKLLGLRARMNLLVQVAKGLAAAHKADVVHRDLKPENILVTKNNVAKLTDFGIAKNLDGTDTHVTDFGVIKGTVTAMSPEQLLSEDIDYRSDLFSLGILAYRLLADQLPFTSTSNPVAAAQNVLNETPTPLNELNDKIPEELSHLVLRLLQRDKQERPSDTGQVALALELLLPEIEIGEEDEDPTVQIRARTEQLSIAHLLTKATPKRKPSKFNSIKKHFRIVLVASISLLLATIYQWTLATKKYSIAVVQPLIEKVGDVPEPRLKRISYLVDSSIGSLFSNSKNYEYIGITQSDIQGIPSKNQFKATGVDTILRPKILCGPFECDIELVFTTLNNENKSNFKASIENNYSIVQKIISEIEKNTKIKSQRNYYKGEITEPRTFNDLVVISDKLKNHPNDKYLLHILSESSLDQIFSHHDQEAFSQKILKLFEPIENKLSQESIYWLFASELNAILGYKEEAFNNLKKYQKFEKSPQNRILNSIRIKDYFETDNSAEEKILKIVKSDPTIKNTLVLISYYLNNKKAENAALIAKDLNTDYPNNHKIISYYADALLLSGSLDEANTLYQQLIRQFKITNTELSNASTSLLLSGNYQAAVELIRQYYNQIVDKQLLLNYADALKLQKSKENIQIYKDIILDETKKENTSSTELAQAYAQIGDIRSAYRVINDLKPNAKDSKFKIDYTKALVFSLANEPELAYINYLSASDSTIDSIWFNLPWFKLLCHEEKFKRSLSVLDTNSICY